MSQNTVEVSVISHYRLVSKLGAGGMGEVYKAHDETLDRPVALKVLPPHLLTNVDRVRRFVQEARSASALNHPNIVTIYEIGQVAIDEDPSTRVHYIAMEYIDGVTLRKKMHDGAPLDQLLEILAQAADGLAKAHNAGIVHRDLKPDNIMITSDGFAKVVDFGLAKLTESRGSGEDTAKTDEGIVMGTVGYMAPEQIDGAIIDQRADIFAFGCILYEACTGRRPFEADSSVDTMHRIVFAEPDPPSQLRVEVTPQLERIILRCLAKKPEARYASIRDVASDLRAIIRGSITPQGGTALPAGGFAAPASGGVPRSGAVSGAVAARVASGPAPAPFVEEKKRRIDYGVIVWRAVLLIAVGVIGYLWWSFPSLDQLGEPGITTAVMERAKEKGVAVDYHWVPYSDLPASLRKIVVADEDSSFFERPRVTLDAVTGGIRRSFEKRQFDVPLKVSPVSRNLANAMLVGDSHSPLASMQAFVVGYGIEQKLNRKQTLETYLNVVQLGDNTFGVEAAAKRYFKKSASDLTTREAALLLAIRKNPLENDPSRPDDTVSAEGKRLMSLIR